MKIDLKSGFATGDISFTEGSSVRYTGTVDTDLLPGIYKMSVNKTAKRWVIQGLGGGLRFYVSLSGPDPFSLSYGPSLRLEVRTIPSFGPSTEEILEGMGPDLYKTHPQYIDRVTAGHYDVASDVFTVDHEDGSTIELDYQSVLKNVQGKGSGIVTVYVYYRNLQNNKIYPRIFDASTTPNIASMVLETEQALPGAKAFGQIKDLILNLILMRSELGKKKPEGRVPWRVKPSGSAAAVRQSLGITGNRPFAQVGPLMGEDSLTSSVELLGKEVRYVVKIISAQGKNAETITSAHRAMIVAAAQEAQRLGQTEFVMHAVNASPDFVRHANALAQAVGRAGSGVAISAPLKDHYEVILDVAKVLASNTP